jgi:hypothetical protein
MLSVFEKALADVALNEYSVYHGYEETDPPLADRIRTYWTALGKTFPGVSTPWSAVFVSWCVKSAGATKKEFHFSDQHSKFVFWAIHNAETNDGLFRAYPIEECAPSVGDIIHNNRPKKKLTFKYAALHDDYPSHSAVVVATGHDSTGRYATTIGGNEGDPGSIRRRRVVLNEDGLILQNPKRPFISVIQTLK